jgi:hypothetical protein
MEEVIPLNIVSSACPEIVDSVPDRWREKSHFLEGVKFWRVLVKPKSTNIKFQQQQGIQIVANQ